MSFPNAQNNPAGAIPVWLTDASEPPSVAAMASPAAVGGTITTGGTAQNIAVTFTANSRYLIIQNPPDAASQGVTAENLFVAINAAAVVNGAANYAVLAPGNCCAIGFSGLRPGAAWTVSVVGATTGHKFLATHFFVDG